MLTYQVGHLARSGDMPVNFILHLLKSFTKKWECCCQLSVTVHGLLVCVQIKNETADCLPSLRNTHTSCISTSTMDVNCECSHLHVVVE